MCAHPRQAGAAGGVLTALADCAKVQKWDNNVSGGRWQPQVAGGVAQRGQTRSAFRTKSDPISWVSVDFYYDFSRQNEKLLMYYLPLR